MSDARRAILAFHSAAPDNANEDDCTEMLDRALGLPPQRWSPSPARDSAHQQAHPGESIVNVATPYHVCRGFVEALAPSADDLVVDLGCGMGRFLMYGAITTPARFRGYEIISERVAIAKQSIDALDLSDRAEAIEANVLSQSLDEGNIFYLFRPFSVETEAEIFARLHTQARRRPVTVVTHRLQPSLFDLDVFERVSIATPQIHRSRDTT